MIETPIFLQVSYVKILGAKLDKFTIKKESPLLATARCPICKEGTSKTKKRFYLYEKSGSINCICHNCGLSTSLLSFLKNNYKQLFDELIFDKLRIIGDSSPVITTRPAPIQQKKTTLDLPLVSTLQDDHFVVKYVRSRKLPKYPFMFAEKFFQFSAQFNDTLCSKNDEPRLIIPFFDKFNNVFAYQGRSFAARPFQKYITIVTDSNTPMIFGLDRLNREKDILLVEGPLDSLFLPNCIASVNASLVATANKLSKTINTVSDRITIILDNEPRNETVVDQYKKAIDAGYKTVVWPQSIKDVKDINQLIIEGYDPPSIIQKNTYKGIEAMIQLNKWKKV